MGRAAAEIAGRRGAIAGSQGVQSDHAHAHGHAHDRGWAGFVRYAHLLPLMWTSEISTAVAVVAPPSPCE